ncbi:MAG: hypothetical protein ACD_22C00096G0003 [uncultured bacterium]|uniref:Uncharacterized protein n=1 Tax=candidate division WWE3 bacterium RBG_16_37_10 TaxID=1802610 RepID=A0A1F4UT45_UNCKA|nr:MAG: hypothetical protein ACD_22C00096G0003 [uncultured bacterium]OGC48131.1 MAG: hypothetical protein A2W32_04690 [candidate division WWE3 bacterium RBG_16_37_10]
MEKASPRCQHHVDPKEIVEVVITDYSEPEAIKSIYSPTLFPHLKIKTNAVTRDIEVVVISTENEDKQLLHKLLMETRTAREGVLKEC